MAKNNTSEDNIAADASLTDAASATPPDATAAQAEAAAAGEKKAPRTLVQKLQGAQALVLKYERMIANGGVDVGTSITVNPGDSVKFNFGRAEKARELTGTFIAERTGEGKVGRQLLIVSGEGFDQQRYTIRPGDIVQNLTNPDQNVEAQNEAEADPLVAAG